MEPRGTHLGIHSWRRNFCHCLLDSCLHSPYYFERDCRFAGTFKWTRENRQWAERREFLGNSFRLHPSDLIEPGVLCLGEPGAWAAVTNQVEQDRRRHGAVPLSVRFSVRGSIPAELECAG